MKLTCFNVSCKALKLFTINYFIKMNFKTCNPYNMISMISTLQSFFNKKYTHSFHVDNVALFMWHNFQLLLSGQIINKHMSIVYLKLEFVQRVLTFKFRYVLHIRLQI